MTAGRSFATDGRDAVVFVSLSRGMGGPARSLLTVLTELDRELSRVLVSPPGDLSYLAVNRGAVDLHLPLPHDPRRRHRARIRAAVLLLRFVRAHRSRIVAIHANGQSELNLSLLATLLTRTPVVLWAHTSVASPTAGVFRAFWRRTRRVRWLAVSSTARDTLVDTLRLQPEAVDVVPNPIDERDVVGERTRCDHVRVAYLGLAALHKGFDLLAPIVERVARDDVLFDLFVAEPSPDTPLPLRPPWEALQAVSQRRPVQLSGRTTDVREAYGNADIVLCPSRQESFGRIAVEAMLHGLPVVASDIAAFRELHDLSGAVVLFPVDDADAAAAAIVRLADDPELREELGRRGRDAAARFLPDQVVPLLASAYRRAR